MKYQESTDEGLVNFVQDVKGGAFRNPAQRSYAIGPLTGRAVADIYRLTGVNAVGFTHNIKGDAIQHIEKRHGENGEADRSMADINDYGKIKYVLDNYDDVNVLYDDDGEVMRSEGHRNSNNESAPMVRYEKRINGTFYVVEAVPDAKAKKLQVVTVYKGKVKKWGQAST